MDAHEKLKEEILACRKCHERFGHEPRPVLRGSPHAPIMHISQAPSVHVHRTGLPFNDQSGKTLRQDWYGISDETFYDEDKFYITTVGKCFPGKNPSGGDKKPPKFCAKLWLDKELELVENDIYLIVGKAASEHFFPGVPLKELIMEDWTIRGKEAFVLPHPSPLNVKMFKDHPAFFEERLPLIRQKIHEILGYQ